MIIAEFSKHRGVGVNLDWMEFIRLPSSQEALHTATMWPLCYPPFPLAKWSFHLHQRATGDLCVACMCELVAECLLLICPGEHNGCLLIETLKWDCIISAVSASPPSKTLRMKQCPPTHWHLHQMQHDEYSDETRMMKTAFTHFEIQVCTPLQLSKDRACW